MELEDRVLIIKRIHVTYRLTVDAGAEDDKIDRAFRAHPSSCPVYRSIHPQIEVTTSLELASPDDGAGA